MSWLLMMAFQGATVLPLPQKTDIPADYSSILCPNEPAARQMTQFLTVKPAPNNHIIDTDTFFAGLKATGCQQDSPDSKVVITIQKILARKTVRLAASSETYAVFRGTNAKGKAVIGVVNETGNDAHPRNDHERWLAEWTRGGVIDIAGNAGADPIYSCATPLAARNVVKAIPTKGGERAKRAAFSKALAANKCEKAARGQYRVTAVHKARTISCGFECEDNYTALTTKRGGRTVGLIFDASHF